MQYFGVVCFVILVLAVLAYSVLFLFVASWSHHKLCITTIYRKISQINESADLQENITKAQFARNQSVDIISKDLFSTFKKRPRILFWTKWFGRTPTFKFYDVTSVRNLVNSCPKKCVYTTNKSLYKSSHAIIYHMWYKDAFLKKDKTTGTFVPDKIPDTRDENQFYIFFLEEPHKRLGNTFFQPYDNFFNWTMTYRRDSDFPLTLGRFKRKSSENIQKYNEAANKIKTLSGKTDILAWAVARCNNTQTNNRNEMVKALQQYLPIHIYGRCGNYSCPSKGEYYTRCYRVMGKRYKFYLAFENSLCEDYVTEKFFYALKYGMVPVVYGKVNYGQRFPPGSFINIDSFASARALSEYLKFLDQNDDEYFKYFRWRKDFHLEYEYNMKETFCNLCIRVHQDFGRRKFMLPLRQWALDENGTTPICSSMQKF